MAAITDSSSSSTSGLPEGIPPLPEDATPEQKDAHWFKHVYQGDKMPQLTVRAVLMGGLLGMLMAGANLYTTLKIGWAFGIAITACVLSFVIWNAMRALTFGRLRQMSILENNCMQSTASASGYSTGSTIATAFGALLLITGSHQPVWIVASITLLTGLLGVLIAIPMKRQMINYEQLRFPSGTAAAETLRSLYSSGAEALQKARALIVALFVGVVVGLLKFGEGQIALLDRAQEWFAKHLFSIRIPEDIPFPGRWTGMSGYVADVAKPGALLAIGQRGFFYDPSVLYIGAGMLTGVRVCFSMLLGCALLYFVVGPKMVEIDQASPAARWAMVEATPNTGKDAEKHPYLIAAPGSGGAVRVPVYTPPDDPKAPLTHPRNIDVAGAGTKMVKGEDGVEQPKTSAGIFHLQRWSLWGGSSLLVFASLAGLALQWKVLAKSFKRVPGAGGTTAASDIEVPLSWLIIGLIPVTIGLLIVQYMAFQMNMFLGLVGIALSFVVSLVCCRATGETDTTPTGAMGKVTQLLYAVLPGAAGNQTMNLMAAGVTSNAGTSSADLLTDLKSGYLLGANPRQQFLAQFIGVFFGTAAICFAWYFMVPTKEALEKFPLPATTIWKAVSDVLAGQGLEAIPKSAQLAIVIGALVGVAITTLNSLLPKSAKWTPSALGLGLAWVITFDNALGFMLGAIIGEVWQRVHKKNADVYSVPVASGFIAGESMILSMLAITAAVINIVNGK